MELKIYLDSNIIVQLENKQLSKEDIFNVIPNKIDSKVLIYYSYAHLVELNESFHTDEDVKKMWINKRLDCLKSISEGWFLDITSELNEMNLSEVDPRAAFNKMGTDKVVNKRIKYYVNGISHETRNIILKLSGINKGEFNNFDSEKVMDKIDEELRKTGLNSIEELVGNYYNLSHPFELSDVITKIFELLDLFGYCSDKQTEKSNFARTLDSNHCFYGAYSDFFITNDRRTRMKSNQVYKYCGLKTQAISMN